MIYIWDSQTAAKKNFMTLPRGGRSVSALAMDAGCTRLAAADMSDDYSLHVFDLMGPKIKERCQIICSGKTDRKKIQMVRFFPGSRDKLMSISTDHVCTWTIDTAKKQMKGAMHTQPKGATNLIYTSLAFSKDGTAYTAASNGIVYKWKETSLVG
jgi:WD40 repeat protein